MKDVKVTQQMSNYELDNREVKLYDRIGEWVCTCRDIHVAVHAIVHVFGGCFPVWDDEEETSLGTKLLVRFNELLKEEQFNKDHTQYIDRPVIAEVVFDKTQTTDRAYLDDDGVHLTLTGGRFNFAGTPPAFYQELKDMQGKAAYRAIIKYPGEQMELIVDLTDGRRHYYFLGAK